MDLPAFFGRTLCKAFDDLQADISGVDLPARTLCKVFGHLHVNISVVDLPPFFTADPFVRCFGHPQVDISGKSNPTPTPGVAVFVPKISDVRKMAISLITFSKISVFND